MGLSCEVKAAWCARPRKTCCGQPVYSDQVMPIWLTLAVAYNQPLRPSDEALRRFVKLIGEDFRLPNFVPFSAADLS